MVHGANQSTILDNEFEEGKEGQALQRFWHVDPGTLKVI